MTTHDVFFRERPKDDATELANFDTWFKERNGCTFEQRHMQEGMRYDDAMRALTVAMRAYVSDMVRNAVKITPALIPLPVIDESLLGEGK